MLGDASVHQPMSTPMSGKYDMPSGPGKLRFDIPPGRPDRGDSMGQGKDGSFLPDDERPDKYVTLRKKKSDPQDMAGKTIMKPATFDGTVAWTDYRAHFEACAELNGWSEEQKGLYLSVSLRGQAQGVFGNLGPGRPSYKKVQVGKDQEKAQSEKDSHSKNRGGKKPNQQPGTYIMKHIVIRMSSHFPNRWPLSYLYLTKNTKTHTKTLSLLSKKGLHHQTRQSYTVYNCVSADRKPRKQWLS